MAAMPTSPARPFVTPLRALTARKAVAWSVGCGLGVWLLLRIFATDLLPVARLLIAWDVAVAMYLISAFWLLRNANPAELERQAAEHRVGRYFVLFISISALIVSLAVIVFEIRAIAAEPEKFQGALVLFVLGTVALSWLFIHTSFATHYTFEYYGPREDGAGKRGGLDFHNDEDPGFLDLWNFSVTIGLCFATADIDITSSSIRRISTVHGVVSFLFNTVILAASVSFAGALLRPAG
jgi:uncharacterized membrane protein